MFVLLALVKLNSLKLVVPVCFSENTERAGNSEGEPQFSHPISLSYLLVPSQFLQEPPSLSPTKVSHELINSLWEIFQPCISHLLITKALKL